MDLVKVNELLISLSTMTMSNEISICQEPVIKNSLHRIQWMMTSIDEKKRTHFYKVYLKVKIKASEIFYIECF